MKKVRWGVLGTAKIAREKVIPALQLSAYCTVDAIASRDTDKANAMAEELRIEKVFGSYEALLQDPDIDAVYIPLPNQLHVPWAIKALEANKHVLCEKPIGLSSAEAIQLLEAAQQFPHLKVMEAFMYKLHPQWQHIRDLLRSGTIGELKTVHAFFSYYNADEQNIRNKPEAGGGGLMDIGCYCISVARFIFEAEPLTVSGKLEFDPVFKTDRLASGILQFEKGTGTFTCSTQAMPYQRVNIFGTKGRIKVDIPFNAPPHIDSHIWLHTVEEIDKIIFEAVDQYTIQGDLFARAILDEDAVPTPLEDAVKNMLVIEAIKNSSDTNKFVPVERF